MDILTIPIAVVLTVAISVWGVILVCVWIALKGASK